MESFFCKLIHNQDKVHTPLKNTIGRISDALQMTFNYQRLTSTLYVARHPIVSHSTPQSASVNVGLGKAARKFKNNEKVHSTHIDCIIAIMLKSSFHFLAPFIS